ncbi:hypothetical protein [Nocardia nova]|uniref:hypothetical protein n=1 Tax=Nocardia nova TaxID=37330 RepID=UPI0015E4755E|nr:hypothetical protein [Nocardia nova]
MFETVAAVVVGPGLLSLIAGTAAICHPDPARRRDALAVLAMLLRVRTPHDSPDRR